MKLEIVKSTRSRKNRRNGLENRPPKNHVDFKFLDNIKAVYEIGRIVNHKQFTMVDVWKAYNEINQS